MLPSLDHPTRSIGPHLTLFLPHHGGNRVVWGASDASNPYSLLRSYSIVLEDPQNPHSIYVFARSLSSIVFHQGSKKLGRSIPQADGKVPRSMSWYRTETGVKHRCSQGETEDEAAWTNFALPWLGHDIRVSIYRMLILRSCNTSWRLSVAGLLRHRGIWLLWASKIIRWFVCYSLSQHLGWRLPHHASSMHELRHRHLLLAIPELIGSFVNSLSQCLDCSPLITPSACITETRTIRFRC